MLNGFMMDPFAPPQQQQQQQQQQQRNGRGGPNNQIQLRSNQFDPFGGMMSPFDRHNALMARHQQSMGNPFALMNQMMSMGNNMPRDFDNMGSVIQADPSSQVYSSSTVMTYSNSADGKPKIYQASTQTKQGPGGVKETRNMVRDSDKGIEKVSIGHHIGDRSHVIERQKLNGQIEEIVNLENLDDEQLNEFNHEFESKIRSSHYHNSNSNHHRHQHLNTNQPFAIEDGGRHRRDKDKERKSKSKPRH